MDSYILKPIDPQEVSAQLLQLKAKLDAKRALEHPEEEMAENDTISEVIRYVDENFRKNISLKSISAHFYMNTSYLGQKFKNVVGECFNDYLNKKRIAYVKRHCHSKHAKMNEIISESGFSNHQYFYKQFQRYEGITFASYISKLNNCDDP